MSARPALAALALLAAILGSRPAQAEPLVADLSQHLVGITTGFSGTDLLLFGATDGPGDIIVVVRGESQQVILRRKERTAGIWLNRQRLVVSGVPGFYAVASNRPLEEIATPLVLALHQVGSGRLDFHIEEGDDALTAQGRADAFAAVTRIKTKQGLYQARAGKLSLLGNQLFRTDIHLPANVPTGTYNVLVILLRDGQVASIKSTPLRVDKIGVGAAVFDFAYRHSALYGIIAVVLALLAGWGAEAAFRRS
ncbi:MAG: TIGR02186 family protein [Alphaproteobacteria bacterium]|nr:TIGR02186 family protein [Alphaproteobacteria bacterium]